MKYVFRLLLYGKKNYTLFLCISAPIYHGLMIYWVIQQQWLYAMVALYCAYFSTYWGIRKLMSTRPVKEFLTRLLYLLSMSVLTVLLVKNLTVIHISHATPHEDQNSISPSILGAKGKTQTQGHKNEIIAKVHSPLGEITITSDQVIHYQHTHPQLSVQNIIQHLIEFELLVLQARQRGFEQVATLQTESKGLMIQHYLQQNFEPQWDQSTLPQHYVEQSIQQNRAIFRHPELRTGSHLLLMPKQNLEEHKPLTAKDTEILAPLIQKVVRDLRQNPPRSQSEFQQRRDVYQTWMPQGYIAHFEFLQRFARRGTYVDAFSKACFAVRQAHTLTDVIQTEFGFHVAWIEEIIAAKETSDADIIRQVKQRIVPEVRLLELQKLIQSLKEYYGVKYITHNIEAVFRRAFANSTHMNLDHP